MTRLFEEDIEKMAIEELEGQGWDYIYGPDIAPDAAVNDR